MQSGKTESNTNFNQSEAHFYLTIILTKLMANINQWQRETER